MLLDVRPDHLEMVLTILQKHLPGREVWAFGSRAKWLAKDYSDLDLCILGNKPLDFLTLAKLEEDFAESDLPYKVDIVDWITTSASFREIIERDKVVVQQAKVHSPHGGNAPDGCMALNAYTDKACGAIPSVIAPGESGAEWTLNSLETLCSLIADCPHSTPVWTDDGVVVLRNQNIKGGRLDLSSASYTDEANFQKRIKRAQPSLGDIVITREAPMGDVCAIPAGLRCCLGQRQVLLRPDPEKINSRFLLFALQSPYVQHQIGWNEGTGSTVSNLRIPVLEALKIPTPPLEIQNKVAILLGALDDRIALLRETNTTLEAIAQALFKSWFVDFDPVHANAAALENKEQVPSLPPEIQALFPATFTDSPQGSIPEGWRWGTIADLAVLNPESWTAKKHPNTVAYIDLANAKDNVIADIAEFEFDAAPSRARRVLRDGDTIVGTVRPGNRSFAFIHDAANNLTGSTGFAVLRPKHEKNTAFTYLAATIDSSIDYLTHIADGGAYPAVKPEVVANLACIVPPVEVLEAFNSVTAELLRKITKNQQQAQVIANLRDTLLPRLISGQLRLPEAEQAIAAITD